jgi:transposase InsO family protein
MAWAQLRFSVIGGLLSSPPVRGELGPEIRRLSQKLWKHPITGQLMVIGASTIERWYYQARKTADPVGALRRKVRSDVGKNRVMSSELLLALERQYLNHKGWSRLLHADNLAALCQEDEGRYGKAPSYSTVRRRMETRGWYRKKERRNPTPGQIRAAERLESLEVRSYEASHVNALWHLDFHQPKRRIADITGQWHTPECLCILDDRSRLCCHIQWYLHETAENLIHGLCQAFHKRGLPRAQMFDRGSAMRAEETKNGLAILGVSYDPTLEYSPYQNGKQEKFWDTLEGRLMAMIEKVEPLTLEFLNQATQAWAELEYNRDKHEELGCSPMARFLQGPDVSRPAPGVEDLRVAFSAEHRRTQRKSDGTVTVKGVRFELPSRLRTLRKPLVRYRSWDLSVAHVVDDRDGTVLARIHPLDKEKNFNGQRRTLAPLSHTDGPQLSQPAPDSDPLPPLMRKLLADYAATGLPPAYLPKDEALLRKDPTNHTATQEKFDD